MDITQEELTKWLEITEQQNQVLQTIYGLELVNIETTPKNILEKYARTYKREIQSNNLFTIIKKLTDDNLILKKEKARYGVNTEGIRERIIESKQQQEKELERMGGLIKDIDKYYKSAALDAKPETTFYDSRELFNKTADALKNATTYYVTSRIPTMTFSRPLLHRIWSEKYADVIQDRCFVKKDLKVVYITQLRTDDVYKNALEIYGKPELAVREVETILDRVLDSTLSNENFEVYYLPNPVGLYISIIEKQEEPTELFLFLQSEENVSGIYLKSREIASHAKKSFLNGIEKATPLASARGKKLVNAAKKQLRENAKL